MNMTQSPAIPLFDEVVNGWNKLSVSGGTKKESSDLRRTRQLAFDKFRQQGFPSIRNEDWKYTNLARFLKDEFTVEGWEVSGKAVPRDAELLKKAAIASLDCYQLVLVNGVWDGQITGGQLPKGIQLLKVAEARQDPTLSVYFEKATGWDEHFANLNAALFSDGLFIRVDQGVAIEKPFHIIHQYTSDSNLLVQPRHVWVVNRNAEISVIETIVSGGAGKCWVNGLTEILYMLMQDCIIPCYRLQVRAQGLFSRPACVSIVRACTIISPLPCPGRTWYGTICRPGWKKIIQRLICTVCTWPRVISWWTTIRW
jgi:hypothetical protein